MKHKTTLLWKSGGKERLEDIPYKGKTGFYVKAMWVGLVQQLLKQDE